MFRTSRRQWIQSSLTGLAAVGAGSLTLRAEAEPTEATPDVHDYQAFLDDKGVPQIQPAKAWEPSGDDVLGPYFLKGAPFRGKVTPPFEPGEALVIRGRVWGHDTKKPLAHAILDVWQADDAGRYDMDDPRNPPSKSEFRNRIRLITDETGLYEYETIKPGRYRVGRGADAYRPAHIHYMIQAKGYRKLITQLYFDGDPYIKKDRTASRSKLVIKTREIKVAGGAYQQGVFDIVLAKA